MLQPLMPRQDTNLLLKISLFFIELHLFVLWSILIKTLSRIQVSPQRFPEIRTKMHFAMHLFLSCKQKFHQGQKNQNNVKGDLFQIHLVQQQSWRFYLGLLFEVIFHNVFSRLSECDRAHRYRISWPTEQARTKYLKYQTCSSFLQNRRQSPWKFHLYCNPESLPSVTQLSLLWPVATAHEWYSSPNLTGN